MEKIVLELPTDKGDMSCSKSCMSGDSDSWDSGYIIRNVTPGQMILNGSGLDRQAASLSRQILGAPIKTTLGSDILMFSIDFNNMNMNMMDTVLTI